jgi:leader peptidase (prepilin peptidase)/N-methyltransferase
VRGKIEEPEAVREEREAMRAELEALSPEERAEIEKELLEDPLADEPGEGVGQSRLAFGPFLVLAILEHLLIGRDVLGAYIAWIEV